MRVKLRRVGNSVGVTIPASELKAIAAKAGDMVELEIKQVIQPARNSWDDPAQWRGADKEPQLLEGVPEAEFDEEEWQW